MMAGLPHPTAAFRAPARAPLTAQSLALALTWLTLALSSIVFSEPAPFDILMIGLVALLPLAGLASFSPVLFLFLGTWLVIAACGLLASALSGVMSVSITHTLITFYLSLAAVVIAAFVRTNPERHVRLVLSGLVFASLLAALAGIAGYFELFPGAQELFTKYGRARGVFKDPNVYGAFFMPALVYCVHAMVSGRARASLGGALLAGLFGFAMLISFSRGAWAGAVVSMCVYVYVMFIAAQSNRTRLKLALLTGFGLSVAVLGLVSIMQVDTIASQIAERATLAQSYDTGPEGRFGGQVKALEIITTDPLGIGAQVFGRTIHGEDVHNVYLSMFLNAGWIGGLLYLALVGATLAGGFRIALRRGPAQGLTIVTLAAFAGFAVEGMIVDTDHWRHFFVVMGLLWGLMAATGLEQQR